MQVNFENSNLCQTKISIPLSEVILLKFYIYFVMIFGMLFSKIDLFLVIFFQHSDLYLAFFIF